jgi:hypothetical protein
MDARDILSQIWETVNPLQGARIYARLWYRVVTKGESQESLEVDCHPSPNDVIIALFAKN